LVLVNNYREFLYRGTKIEKMQGVVSFLLITLAGNYQYRGNGNGTLYAVVNPL
jgi:hypothetical protein